MRNGMSVQEIYDALDQLERLIKAYDEERSKTIKTNTAILKITQRINRTVEQYNRLADDPRTQMTDSFEFKGRVNGLLEAKEIIRMAFEEGEPEL